MLLKNYYHTLVIDSKSDLETIKKAFRKEIAIYHPEHNKSPEAIQKFDALIEAYDVLSNPHKRLAYDKVLHTSINQKTVAIESKETIQFQEWEKEAKVKSTTYREVSLTELLLVDILVNESVFDVLLSGVESVGDALGDTLDGVFDIL